VLTTLGIIRETIIKAFINKYLLKKLKVFLRNTEVAMELRISKSLQARGVKIDGLPLTSSSGTSIDETARFEGYSAQKLCS
jgi:hypothetical protein